MILYTRYHLRRWLLRLRRRVLLGDSRSPSQRGRAACRAIGIGDDEGGPRLLL